MNSAIQKHVAMLRATQERQQAIESLERVKRRGDTQAVNRAQRRVNDATHRLMKAEREVLA